MKRSNAEKLSEDQTKIWYSQENPKKKGSGSRDRYESYKHATTVGEALQLGSYKADLKHDFNRGYLHLEDVEARPAASASASAARGRDPNDDPIEDQSPGDEKAAPSRGSRKSRSKRGASQQDISQAFKKLKKQHIEIDEEAILDDQPSQRQDSKGLRLSEPRRPASPLQCDQLTVSDLCSGPLEDMSQAEEPRDVEIGDDKDVAPTENDSSAEEPFESCVLTFSPDRPEDQRHQEFEVCKAFEEEVEEAADDRVPISQCSQDADAEEITLRCRLGIRIVKEEVEEPDDGSSAAQVPEVPKGDLRQFFRQQRSESGQEEEQEHDTNAEDENEEKQAFESAQELSLEQNRSERQLRRERERDLLDQGSLEPLERLDLALVDAFTDAGLLTWLESEENRRLLYEYLELQTKAVTWYKEPAQAYFDERRRIMLASLEQPDAAEAVAKFLEEEMATAQKAIYHMPDKGHYLPSLFMHYEEDLQGCVDLDT